jgi:FixJ family two-component response regulator
LGESAKCVPLISIVDDDDPFCQAVSSLIRSTGSRCATFCSAEAFLASGLLAETACLVLDVQMPGLSGLELQLRLKQLACAIPIVLMTANADEGLRVQALKQGAVAFLRKPFPANVLLRTISLSLNGRHDGTSGSNYETDGDLHN